MLWLRLKNRKPAFNIALDCASKGFLWKSSIIPNDELQFFELAACRPTIPPKSTAAEQVTYKCIYVINTIDIIFIKMGLILFYKKQNFDKNKVNPLLKWFKTI